MSAKHGGPAFPTTAYYDEKPYGIEEGMTLRDYFAAHAPEPAGWFEPNYPPRPEPKYDHDHGDRCFSVIDGSQLCSASNGAELEAWSDGYTRAYSVQWPYAWADAMLAERVK